MVIEIRNPMAWLYEVLRNYLWDRMRAASAQREVAADHMERMQDLRHDPEVMAVCDQMARQIAATLSGRELKCLRLRTEGLSYEEIGQTMQLRPGTVGAMLVRAHEKIRKRVQIDGGATTSLARRGCPRGFFASACRRSVHLGLTKPAQVLPESLAGLLLDQSDHLDRVAARHIGEVVAHIAGALQGKLVGDHNGVLGRRSARDSNGWVPGELDQRCRGVDCALKVRGGATLEGIRLYPATAAAPILEIEDSRVRRVVIGRAQLHTGVRAEANWRVRILLIVRVVNKNITTNNDRVRVLRADAATDEDVAAG
jgi:hypothetical protein